MTESASTSTSPGSSAPIKTSPSNTSPTNTVLVLNCGSSSVKYELVAPHGGATDAPDGIHVASGIIERIGEPESRLDHSYAGQSHERHAPIATHREAVEAIQTMFAEFGPSLSSSRIVGVGHRVVMGGREFARSVVVDDEVLAQVAKLSPLAPLHNPANLTGIEVAQQMFPELPHVAVFDTGFFYDLPPAASTYALDRDIAERHGIRRYGFHGTSHQYVSRKAAEFLGRDLAELRQVVLHLGNGASASAVQGGVAVDTSMGFTPLEGLVMGSRTGDIDAAVVIHLARNAGMGIDEIDDLLNRKSGMKGLSGFNDMRDVHRAIAEGDPHARLALDVYVHRLKKYIGAYAAVMGGLDVVTFTAGVGENDAVVRAEVLSGLEFLGIRLDPGRNNMPNTGPRLISSDPRPGTDDGAALVIPTDEELTIAQETIELLFS